MYDLSVPNKTPGCCAKCNGTGRYSWGPVINGQVRYSGRCNACQGTGSQTNSDIHRNRAYNRHKLVAMTRAGFAREG